MQIPGKHHNPIRDRHVVDGRLFSAGNKPDERLQAMVREPEHQRNVSAQLPARDCPGNEGVFRHRHAHGRGAKARSDSLLVHEEVPRHQLRVGPDVPLSLRRHLLDASLVQQRPLRARRAPRSRPPV